MSVSPSRRRPGGAAALLVAVALTAAACGGGSGGTGGTDGAQADGPTVVVTTSVLGDIARTVLADTDATIEVLVPAGVDAHGYAPSAADGIALREAALVLAVGLGLEEALEDTLAAASADGVDVVELAPLVDPLPYAGGVGHGDEDHGDEDHGDDDHGDDDHGDEDHGDEDHGDEDHGDDDHGDEDHGDEDHGDEDHGEEDHGHGGLDPHVWLDPFRAGRLAEEVARAWATLVPADTDGVEEAAAAYVATMAALDEELQALVATVPVDRRLLVTNHEALGYLADRYAMTVVGTVLPGTTTDVNTDAASFAALADTIRETGAPAVFAETTASDRLARALADEVGDVAVVELFTESLGAEGSGAETLEGLIRTDVERIVAALG